MNCLIYPFYDCHESLVKTINTIRKDIVVTEKVVPNGCAPALKEKGYEFTIDFNSALKNVEGVIITDCRNRKWMKKDIISRIKHALECDKTVYNCTELNQHELSEIEKTSGYNAGKFINYAVYPDDIDISNHVFMEVDCPVIATGNMLRGLDDCTSLFELTGKFTEKGFKTVPVGSTFDSVLIGGYAFPDNIYNLSSTEEDKVMMFNKYLNDIQLIKGADAIVLNFPEGFMKYSNELNAGFGIRALMAASAVSVDYFIFNIPFDQINEKAVAGLNTHLEQKYNITIDEFAVDSQYVNYGDSLESNDIVYSKADKDDVDMMVAEYNKVQLAIPFFNLKNRNSYDDVVSRCMAKLS